MFPIGLNWIIGKSIPAFRNFSNCIFASSGEPEIQSEFNIESVTSSWFDLNPDFFGGHLYAGQAYLRLGKFEEAIHEGKMAVDLEKIPYSLSSLGVVYGFIGDTIKAKKIIEEA